MVPVVGKFDTLIIKAELNKTNDFQSVPMTVDPECDIDILNIQIYLQ